MLGWYPNRFRNHPDTVSDPHTQSSYHAEIGALRMASDARGATVYVARHAGNGKPGQSRPCEACELALREAGVRKVIYTDPNGPKIEIYR